MTFLWSTLNSISESKKTMHETRITCQSDEEGNLVLEFPDELLEAMGWKEGDELSVEAIADRLIFSRVAN